MTDAAQDAACVLLDNDAAHSWYECYSDTVHVVGREHRWGRTTQTIKQDELNKDNLKY